MFERTFWTVALVASCIIWAWVLVALTVGLEAHMTLALG